VRSKSPLAVTQEKHLLSLLTVFALTLSVLSSHGCGKPRPMLSLSKIRETGTTVLSRRQVGIFIEDGVGFGGIRLGDKEAELLKKWGATRVSEEDSGKKYQYFLHTSAILVVRNWRYWRKSLK
jgi:hypothetical protein